MTGREGQRTGEAAPVTTDELHLAWAQVPNTAGQGGFEQALGNPLVRQLLERLVLINRRKHSARAIPNFN